MLKENELLNFEEIRVKKGKTSIVEIMTKEEMISYRENLLVWIKERENKSFSSEYMKTNNDKQIAFYKSELNQIKEVAKKDAIQTFLENWEKQVFDYYMDLAKEYSAITANKQNIINELIENGFNEGAAIFKADDIIRKQKSEYRKNLINKDADIIRMSELNNFEIELKSMLESESKIKYNKIVTAVEKKVGPIKTAELFIFPNGELNGKIKGENGECKVTTISAGGFNKQCFHFRTIVK